MKVDRSGLGLSSESSKLNYDHFYKYLTDYKSEETATYDLVFSKEFDKDERKSLHEYVNGHPIDVYIAVQLQIFHSQNCQSAVVTIAQ